MCAIKFHTFLSDWYAKTEPLPNITEVFCFFRTLELTDGTMKRKVKFPRWL